MDNDVEMPRLSRPERWAAAYIVDRQRTHRTPAIILLEQNYGPAGIRLMAAALLTGLAGAIIACTGIVVLLASNDHGALVGVGYGLLGLAIVMEAPSIVRAAQGVRAGRRFRGPRPFVKRAKV
jgi:hypothetical protein